MPKLSSRLGQITSEVKRFVAEHGTLAHGRAALAHGIDLIFPPHSLSSSDAGLMQAGMAPELWARIRFLDAEGCDMCARPFDGGLHFGAGAKCDSCTEKPFPFTRTRAACVYGDGSREIILGFKHGDRLDLAPMLVRWLQRAGAESLVEADAVVPVPLHPFRLFERRYNQSAELARPLARLAGLAYLPDALRRTRRTKVQATSAEQRWANVKGAFAVSKAGEKRLRDRHVVLIDDVFTTGATLRACAETLLKAGARRVDALVLARTLPSAAS